MKRVTCPRCNGKQRLTELLVTERLDNGDYKYRRARLWCFFCRGTGKVTEQKARTYDSTSIHP